jgi:hypothetical protein
MTVDHNHLRKQSNREQIAQQIVQNLVTQGETEIQQLNPGIRKPPQNTMSIEIGLTPFKMNETMNIPILKYYELQQQLAQPLDNN